MMYVLSASVGLLLGGVVAYLYAAQQTAKAESARKALRDQIDNQAAQHERHLQQQRETYEQRIEKLVDERNTLEERVNELSEERGELRSANEELEQQLKTQESSLEAQQERLREQFENLANDILEKKSETFIARNEKNINTLLKPLNKKMKDFREVVQETYEKNLEGRSALKTEIHTLTKLNQEMSQRASDLATALEGQSKTQGDWGEMILERILEESGLTKGREYETQVSETVDGRRLRPDVVVKLPNDRFVVVDAKVSITAYRRYVSAKGDGERAGAEEDGEQTSEKHLQQHIESVRNHVQTLSGKPYDRLYDDRSPDFVLLFMPIEPAFALALQHDEQLYQDAFDKHVIIVSPTTLQATLATIANIWRHEHQSRNAQKIAERGGKLYDKFVLFAEALEDVGKRIDQVQESYQTVRNRLVDGRGNLTRQVEMLQELRVDSKKSLPESVARDALDT